jgi:NAD(P)-dependent dehydrogenase (short-subunit alcohol dehydrogenase family)
MLVAGGTGRIGGAVVRHALAAGWRVAVHGRSAAKGDGASSKGFRVDVAQHDAAGRLVADVLTWTGRIDAVVDCVATGPAARITGAFEDTEPDAYAAFLDLSLGHLQRLAHAALPALSKQGGTLIAFASDAGRFAAPRQVMIGASRAGIIGFVRNLSQEVSRDGVRVHCVSPGYVDTEDARAPADRVAKARARAGLGLPTPDDIAPLVLFLCGDGARRITGQVISVNGGMNA